VGEKRKSQHGKDRVVQNFPFSRLVSSVGMPFLSALSSND